MQMSYDKMMFYKLVAHLKEKADMRMKAKKGQIMNLVQMISAILVYYFNLFWFWCKVTHKYDPLCAFYLAPVHTDL